MLVVAVRHFPLAAKRSTSIPASLRIRAKGRGEGRGG